MVTQRVLGRLKHESQRYMAGRGCSGNKRCIKGEAGEMDTLPCPGAPAACSVVCSPAGRTAAGRRLPGPPHCLLPAGVTPQVLLRHVSPLRVCPCRLSAGLRLRHTAQTSTENTAAQRAVYLGERSWGQEQGPGGSGAGQPFLRLGSIPLASSPVGGAPGSARPTSILRLPPSPGCARPCTWLCSCKGPAFSLVDVTCLV